MKDFATQTQLRSGSRHNRATLRGGNAYPWWFLTGSAAVVALAIVDIPETQLFVLSLLLLIAASGERWRLFLTFTLSSLTLSATGSKVAIDQPFLLRFVLLAALVVLLLVLNPPDRTIHHVRRTQLVLVSFLVWAGLSAAVSQFPSGALEAVLGTAATFAVPAVAVRGRWQDREVLISDLFVMHRFLWLFTFVGLGVAAAMGFTGRAAGLQSNPNTFAFIAALGFGLGLGLRLRMPQLVGWATLLTFATAVIASGSRGALVGVFAAQGYLLLRRGVRRRVVTVVSSLFVGFAVLLSVPTVGQFDLAAVYARTFGGEELNLGGRQVRWQDMQTLINQRPIVGHGLRMSGEVLAVTGARGMTASAGAHSSYLTVTAETGIVGAVLLFGVVLLQLRRRPPPDEAGTIAWSAGSGVVVAGLGHMIGESFILGVGSPFPLVFWTATLVVSLVTASPAAGRR